MVERHTGDYSLSEQELFDYRQQGFLVREGVFCGEELEKLRQAVESAVDLAFELCEQGQTYFLDHKRFVDVGPLTVQFEHEPGSDTIRVIEPVHHLNPALESLVADERILSPVRDILECDAVSIWTNKLNLKRAHEGSGFGWHQDSPYWVHDCNHVDLLPNVYLAFDDATEANGCLKVIRGSHRQGCLPGTNDGSQLGGFFTDPRCFDERDQVAMIAPAGSLVFFDPHIIHGSQPNHSGQSRRAIVMTYQPADHPMLKTGEIANVVSFQQPGN